MHGPKECSIYIATFIVGVLARHQLRLRQQAVTENSQGYLFVKNDPILWAMLNAIKEQQGDESNYL